MSKVWGILSPKNRGSKTTYFRHFLTTSHLNGNFNGLYLWNEMLYTESGKCIGNYKGSHKSHQM